MLIIQKSNEQLGKELIEIKMTLKEMKEVNKK
jgi:hypothetical protein